MSCVYMSNAENQMKYSRLEVNVGHTVKLLCNTSLSREIMWAYDSDDDDGYVDYVYWEGRIDSDKPRLFVKRTKDDHHILFISDAQMNNSGLYDCYDGEGVRKIGYRLIVNGMFYDAVLNCYCKRKG